MPRAVRNGASRMAVRSAPTSAAAAATSSFKNRKRFSRLPPYLSVRLLEAVRRNWSTM
jgi:hypothetical protein